MKVGPLVRGDAPSWFPAGSWKLLKDQQKGIWDYCVRSLLNVGTGYQAQNNKDGKMYRKFEILVLIPWELWRHRNWNSIAGKLATKQTPTLAFEDLTFIDLPKLVNLLMRRREMQALTQPCHCSLAATRVPGPCTPKLPAEASPWLNVFRSQLNCALQGPRQCLRHHSLKLHFSCTLSYWPWANVRIVDDTQSLRLAPPNVKTHPFLPNFIRYTPTTGNAALNMASLLEMGQTLLWTGYETAKATPLPILLTLLLTTIVATLAFVCPPRTCEPAPLPQE